MRIAPTDQCEHGVHKRCWRCEHLWEFEDLRVVPITPRAYPETYFDELPVPADSDHPWSPA
jgi:hypothetical protein